MASRWRKRNYTNPRIEHNNQSTRPSTSQGRGDHPNRHSFNNKNTFKAKNHRVNYIRKNWHAKTNLVHKQLDGKFSNQNGPARYNYRQRSDSEPHNSRRLVNNFSSYTLMESVTGWYSVIVPNVDNYCDEILKTIQTSIMPVVFFPFNKKIIKNSLRFLVDDFEVAKTLLNASCKIPFKDFPKLVIKVFIHSPSRLLTSFTPVSSEVRGKIVEAIVLAASRCNTNTKCLDLSKFHTCPLFIQNQLFVPLNHPAVLLATLNIVAQHTKNDLYGLSLSDNFIYSGEGLIWIRRLFPDLKALDLSGNKLTDLNELKSLTNFSIEVLCLFGNPLCNTIDKDKYRQDVQQYFPMITELDNSELPSQYNAIFRPKLKMPVNRDNCYSISDGHNPQHLNPLMSLVEKFLMDFYERYDNNVSRQLVAEAYHKNASFSLSSRFMTYHGKGTLTQYTPGSRNFLMPDTNSQRRSLMHKGSDNIINFFNKLPKTKHDLGSFVIDVPFVNAGMVQIIVNGVFAENFKVNDKRDVFRSFCRTFCIKPYDVGWRIISDMMFVTLANDELMLESRKRFYVLKPNLVLNKNSYTSSNNSVSTFMEDDEEMGCKESSFQQSTTTNNHSPFQQTTLPLYQPSLTPVNLQQPILCLSDMQTLTSQKQPTDFKPQNQYLSLVPNNKLSARVSLNSSIGNANANSDCKLAMIKSFSNESGMNDEWTKKCLEDNNWDYAKAAFCFSKLKEKIPPVAFRQKT